MARSSNRHFRRLGVFVVALVTATQSLAAENPQVGVEPAQIESTIVYRAAFLAQSSAVNVATIVETWYLPPLNSAPDQGRLTATSNSWDLAGKNAVEDDVEQDIDFFRPRLDYCLPRNLGDGQRKELNVDASTRLEFIDAQDSLRSMGIDPQDSVLTKSFAGIERRLQDNRHWFGRVSLSPELIANAVGYSINHFNSAQDGSGRARFDSGHARIDSSRARMESGRARLDINDDNVGKGAYGSRTFLEKIDFHGLSFRLGIQNGHDPSRCRINTRFIGTSEIQSVEGIEDFCSGYGINYGLMVRQTF